MTSQFGKFRRTWRVYLRYRVAWDTVDDKHDQLRLMHSQRGYSRIYHCTAFPKWNAITPLDVPAGPPFDSDLVRKFNAFLRAGGFYEQVTRTHTLERFGDATNLDYTLPEMRRVLQYYNDFV